MTTQKATNDAIVEAVVAAVGYVLATVIALPVMAVLIALVAIYEGFAIWILWGWFAVPLGIPAIGLAHAIGVDLLIGMFQPARFVTDDFDWAAWARTILFRPALAIAAGYVVLQYI